MAIKCLIPNILKSIIGDCKRHKKTFLENRKERSDRDVLTYVPVRGDGEPIVCSSYQQSAIAHGYVDSVQDVTLTYDDMCSNGTASQCRSYFVVLTVHGYATHAIFDDYERRRSHNMQGQSHSHWKA